MKLMSALLIALVCLFGNVCAEAESNIKDFYSKLYFTHNIGFEEIAAKDIVTPSDTTVIYPDEGETQGRINAFTLPVNATGKPIKFTSDNPDVTIDEKGCFTFNNGYGSAVITMRCGDITRTHKVYATKRITRLSFSAAELTMYADRPEKVQLTLNVEPADVDISMLKWYSGNEGVAHINPDGTVIPNGVGTTSVYAATPDGTKTAKCTVYSGLYDVSIKAVFISNAIDKIRTGAEYSLSAYVYPETVGDKSVTWSSSNSIVASVDQNGVVKGLEPGRATIAAETKNGRRDSFEIEVLPSNAKNADYKIVSKSVDERIAELMTKPQFIDYSYSIDEMTDVQMSRSPVKYSENRAAERDELKNAVNPAKNVSGSGKYQFIDLSQSNNVDADTLNRYLVGKGILEGRGADFKAAAERYGISELYLVTHACLETGDGYSRLANGVEVNGVTVYNMFGIGAYDTDAVKYGANHAYSMGWTTVEAAIDGGAAWISQNYINNPNYRQNTLYKMRWNPDMPGEHQYATDIDWATGQALTLKSMFDAFPNAELYYEIPLYKGEKEFDLR